MNIQADYGEFDTRFLGVNLRFHASHPATWELFDKIGTDKRIPSQVVEIGNAALQESPERAFEVFSIGTVLTHELRHFHDFILSPYGNALFRLRLSILMNGFQTLPFVRARTTVPVPLPKWLAKSSSEQAALIHGWQQLRKVSVEPFDMPAEHEALVYQASRTYANINQFLVNPQSVSATTAFQPYHLMEASAFITQVQAVYSVFGQQQVEAFINFVLNHPKAGSYSTVFRLLYKMWEAAERPIEAKLMNGIVTWCLLGDFINDGWKACPTVRFARLHELLKNDGLPQYESLLELFEEWSERLSYSPIATAFSRNQQSTRRFIEHLQTNSSRYPDFMHELLADVLEVTEGLLRANSHMAEVFQTDPLAYVSPYEYIQNSDLWPAAPIGVTFVGGGLSMTAAKMETLERQGTLIQKAKASDDCDSILVLKMIYAQSSDGLDLIDRPAAMNIADQLTMTDFFFSESRRSDPEFDVVRYVLESEGVTPLEILM